MSEFLEGDRVRWKELDGVIHYGIIESRSDSIWLPGRILLLIVSENLSISNYEDFWVNRFDLMKSDE